VAIVAFADESGTDNRSQCYAIGALSVAVEERAWLEEAITSLKNSHGVMGEAKWTRIRNNHGAINFALGCLDVVLRRPTIAFDIIVVNKSLYNNWRGDARQQETAFYKTYTYLLRHIARRIGDATEVLIDDRSDSYGLHHEVVQTVGNRMLTRLAATGRLASVTRVDSRQSLGIQVADVLTGAINTAHLLREQRPPQIHRGKHLAIQRLARSLGWDHLGYDTYPHPKFNVWHFPIEYRGPSRDPAPRADVSYITAEDLGPGPDRAH
jgi:hypothetical protein